MVSSGSRVVGACCSLLLLACIHCETPPDILRDPTFLKLLATHYPGSVLQPKPPPAVRPEASQTHYSMARPQQEQGQYGTRIRDFQPSGNSSASTITPSIEQAYYSYQTAAVGPNQYVDAPNHAGDDPRAVRWSASGQGYPRPGFVRRPPPDASTSYTAPQHHYSRPVAYYKKAPMYLNKGKIVKIADSSPPKYVKVAPKIYLTKPVAYKKSWYPGPFNKQQMKKNTYYRRQHPSYHSPYTYETVRPKVKVPFVEYPTSYETTPRTKGNTTAELHQYYQTTERVSEQFVERPLVHSRSNNSQINYYDSYEDSTEGALGFDGMTRGYYGDRLYMSTQSPDIDRMMRPRLQEDLEDLDTLFD